jgi:apolipoprotein N-acyltransferase
LFGYSWISLPPIAQSVSVIGSYGLNFLTIFWGAVLGLWVIYPRRKTSIIIFNIALISFIATYAFGQYRLENATPEFAPNINLQIIQANISQEAKWDSKKLVQNFEKHIQLTAQKEKTQSQNIIVWPETALPPAFINNAAVNERIYSVLGANDILLTGALNVTKGLETDETQYHNALLLWSAEQRAKQLYSKSHLVPFGEYIPFQKFIPLPTVTSFSGFDKGAGTQTIKVGNKPSFSPLICYEIIFPHQSALKDENRPHYILTITNDGWYGNSPGPYQHFVQSRFRAIETGLPVVRSANTGISGVLDPYGRAVVSSQYNEAISLSSKLPISTVNETIYFYWGDKPFIALILIVFALTVRRKKTQP